MHSKSNNAKITINDKEDEVIEEHFQSLFPRYHSRLEKSIKSSGFILIVVVYSITNAVK